MQTVWYINGTCSCKLGQPKNGAVSCILQALQQLGIERRALKFGMDQRKGIRVLTKIVQGRDIFFHELINPLVARRGHPGHALCSLVLFIISTIQEHCFYCLLDSQYRQNQQYVRRVVLVVSCRTVQSHDMVVPLDCKQLLHT